MSVNETRVEAKMCTFTLESTHFIFKKCPIDTHDGASAKLSTNLQETDYSADSEPSKLLDHPEQKGWEGRGPPTNIHLPQSPFTGQFFLDGDILVWCQYS